MWSTGVCTCSSLYTGEDCAVKKMDPPTVSELANAGFCDLAPEGADCSQLTVYGANFYPSPSLACFLQNAQVTRSLSYDVYFVLSYGMCCLIFLAFFSEQSA